MSNMCKKIVLIILTLAVLSVTVYAWAYVNNKVKIDGVQVKPSGSEGLYISNNENGSFSAIVTASTSTARALSAVSTADLVNWYIPANSLNRTESGAYSSEFVSIDSATASEYYFSENFYVKSTEGTGGLKITGITVKNPDGTAPDENISSALRVGIRTSSHKVFIFAPVEGYDSACSVIGEGGNATYQNIKASSNTTVINAMQANEVNTLTVFVWYEGQDSNYNVNNLYNPEELVISIDFTVLPLN